MSTHMGRTYLNSCVKVPIDPCNNCPAPVYNRPKLCMGKKTKVSASSCKQQDAAVASTWTDQAGIRTLAKFYDSIPDYCEVKHLHKAEFYSTLESLRTTSRELRALPTHPELKEARASSSSNCSATKPRHVKGKKLKKKTPRIPPLILAEHPIMPTPPDITHSSSCLSDEYEKCVRDLSRITNFKQEFALEVADFKRSLKLFEKEFKRNAERPKSTSSSTQASKAAPSAKVPAMHTAARAKVRSEMLRKCFSVNDLSASSTPAPKLELLTLSNYFPTKEVPKLHIESPPASSKRSSCSAASGSSRVRRRRARTAKVAAVDTDQQQPELLNIFEVEQVPTKRTSSVSPQHPVARPNLAATLRAEVSRKKVKELQNNCTYHDPRPQFDWEVRKTPAWKSLSLNESHKALLSIRLATRKAEQALQERQYELHMQMMKQRVKSAPLLLEGPTFWGPEVGKLSHSCRSEGMRHACESSLQRRSKQPKKKCSSSRCPTAVTDAEAKLQQIRKIYGSPLKCSSRQSQRSTSRRRQVEQTPEPHDSGDDLCSVDRAFL
ncbi:uncharacterized protein [Drosophila virilis]|uniref:Uncharacterized protein n=1 Tax=Drosophila virilis TaxID=7244 RepID=B4M4X5_DROVI|nr:uncharacterized protein LOC6632957 [Drosophila virilis]EDW59686.2 uncharacterized protein Dvir_GJ10148 [Drosophila virilis]